MLSGKGNPDFGMECEGIVGCFLQDAAEGLIIRPSVKLLEDLSFEFEMRVATPRVTLEEGKAYIEDTAGDGGSVFVRLEGDGNTGIAGATVRPGMTLPFKFCVEDCEGSTPRFLYVIGDLSFGLSATETTVRGDLTMVGWWMRAFGSDILHIGDLRVGIALDVKTTPFPIPVELEIGGRICVGHADLCGNADQIADDADGNVIMGLVYGGYFLNDPTANYVLAQTSEITYNKLFGILGDNMNAKFLEWREFLPALVREAGIYPLKLDCTPQETADPTNTDCFARFSFSPARARVCPRTLLILALCPPAKYGDASVWGLVLLTIGNSCLHL